MSTIFTFPGKSGDAILQWPIAYHWARQKDQKITCWLDEKTCGLVENLFRGQPCVEAVEMKPGIEHWNCGGQPWHFGLETKDFDGHTVYHLGLRAFPQRQITLETMERSKAVVVDQHELAETPSIVAPAWEPKNRLVLHGQTVYGHTKSSPGFWKFLTSIRKDIEERFDEVVWVGSARDREVGVRTYPEWKDFDDQGDFMNLAGLIGGSKLVIGVGSSVVALAGAMKVPCIRVHDPIGQNSKVIWSNLGQNQINDTEVELRKSWPSFRDQWARSEVGV